MLVTLLGITMDDKEEQSEKALVPIVIKFLGKEIVIREEQPEKNP